MVRMDGARLPGDVRRLLGGWWWWLVHVTAPPRSPPGDRRPPQSQCVNVPSYMFAVQEHIIKVIFFHKLLLALSFLLDNSPQNDMLLH